MKGEAVILSRRSVLAGSGALVVNFSSLGRVAAQQGGGEQGAAMRALAAAARWQETATLPNGAALPDFLKAQPARDIAVLDARAACGRGEVAVGDLYAALYRAWLDRSLMRCRVVRRRCHDDLESHAGR